MPLTLSRDICVDLLERAPKIDHRSRWRCRCDCGAVKVVLACSLLDGTIKSCGCLRRELGADKARRMREALCRSQSRFQRLRGAVETLFSGPRETTRHDPDGRVVRTVRGSRY